MAKPSIQKSLLIPASLLEHVEGTGGGGHTFTLTVCAALLRFFTEGDDDERHFWFRAQQLVRKGKLDWRRAASWVADERQKEGAA
jgi:hypothetical protein